MFCYQQLLLSKEYLLQLLIRLLVDTIRGPYTSQRGREHVTAIPSSIPSKIQAKQWYVTHYYD